METRVGMEMGKTRVKQLEQKAKRGYCLMNLTLHFLEAKVKRKIKELHSNLTKADT